MLGKRHGTRSPHEAASASTTPKAAMKITAALGALDARKLKSLYARLLQCRMIAERAVRVLNGRSSPTGYVCVPGEEAILVGGLSHLLPGDCVASSRRDLLCDFLRGASLKDLFEQMRKRSSTAARPSSPAKKRGFAEFSVIAPLPTAAGAVPVIMGAGVALGFKLQKRPLVTVAFSLDDASTQAPWRESLRFAAHHKLPVVHLVRCGVPGARKHGQSAPSAKLLSQLALDCELPAITVDASDAVAIYRVAFEAIRRAREGHGPSLILCIPCRVDAGKTATAALRHSRSKGPNPSVRWEPHDPVVFMENYLRQKGLWSDAWKKALVRRKLAVSK
jgi:TPP-dependent pyruvate/acetoin dehydrogenase alpha subunit